MAFFENINLSVMETVFLGCAIIGGGLFLLRSIMMLVGLGGDDHSDGDAGDVSAVDDGSAVLALKLVTLHGLTAFLLMFGLVGFLILRNDAEANKWFVGGAATVAGLVTMIIIAKIFQSSRKLQSDGTIYPKDIVGVEGSVYLVIRPGCIGKVQLTARNALKVFDARAKDPATEIKTGERVKVVEAGDALVVERS